MRPKPIEVYDLRRLIEVCELYLDEIENGEDEDSDSPHYIFEAAISAIYGDRAWEWINDER